MPDISNSHTVPGLEPTSSTVLSAFIKVLKTSAIAGASTAILALLAVYAFQSKIIYPAALNGGHGRVSTPDEYGLPYEAVDLHTKDGETLKSYLLLHDKNDPSYTNKTVMILSPNAGNIGHFLPVVKYIFNALNYNVFIYSYRGYGRSTGSPSEFGLKVDADTAMEFVGKHSQLSESSLVCYGRSIGGAVAIYIAYKFPDQVSGLILDNTFLSIPKVIPYIFPVLGPFSFLCHEKWPSEEYMKQVPASIPVLFLSAKKDEIVPPAHMKKLRALSKSTQKVWREFDDAHHNDSIAASGYWDAFYDFMCDAVSPVGR
ncbi:DEKNAAC101781 [Brettanomyces naardenensis]|uniref:DEKNAAC101781 n=1 Tax=Brettanomyces naardenensis TaxID=13370 RepID=A0A448YJ65_BRENA|nr:DEKNAAC101781 [Brettanomyces naardenensis]